MITLATPVTALLPQLAARVHTQLTHLGIQTVQDLLFYFPYRHEDYRVITPLGSLGLIPDGGRVCVEARVDLLRTFRSPKRQMMITEGFISDDSGSAKVMWFHQPYVAKALPTGVKAFFIGRVSGNRSKEFLNPSFERIGNNETRARDAGHIVGVYRSTEGLTQRMFRALLRRALPSVSSLKDWQPKEVLQDERLLSFAAAVESIHFPADPAILAAAGTRLAFDELFLFQARAFAASAYFRRTPAPEIPFAEAETRRFVAALPFQLTTAQRKAAWEIIGDLKQPHPMNRMLHGDVGSGKTVVASLAMLNVARSGSQSALLAPTEILAQQHFRVFVQYFEHTEMPVALLTASGVQIGSRRTTKTTLLKRLRSGEIAMVIGTHALLQPPVLIPKLALAVVDEQHRFGVAQRAALTQRRGSDGIAPHVLTMTATPIPRTLALTLYSDMDLSVLDTAPTTRAGVTTRVVGGDDRGVVEAHLRKEISAGHGAFVLCPRIEVESPSGDTLIDWEGARSVKAERERLGAVLPAAAIGMLHGRMKPEKKEEIMEQFRSGDLDVLVTTSVVEVGIDVPRATMMLVENAEMFGLAQLHQLRGRVGRGTLPGICYLMMGTLDTEAQKRVRILEHVTDGFVLAERDLELRGPSHLSGQEQSGWPKFRIADVHDKAMVERTHRVVKKLFKKDSTLKTWPKVRAAVMTRRASEI